MAEGQQIGSESNQALAGVKVLDFMWAMARPRLDPYSGRLRSDRCAD